MLIWVIRSWAISMEVFIRHSMGVRYPGGYAAPVLLLVPGYCLFWEGYDIRPMLWFLGAFLLMCGRHRMSALWRTSRPQSREEHSYYTGVSYLQRWFPRTDEIILKMWIEPLFILGAGLLTLALNPPLGMYIMIGAGCRCVMSLISEFEVRTRVRDMQDQVIEQRIAAERFRRGQRY